MGDPAHESSLQGQLHRWCALCKPMEGDHACFAVALLKFLTTFLNKGRCIFIFPWVLQIMELKVPSYFSAPLLAAE